MAKNTNSFPYIGLAVGILAVSTASTFIRFAQVEAESIVIAAYRLGVATLILLPIFLLRHRRAYTDLPKRDLVLGLISGALLAFHFWSWITSLEHTDVASSVVIVTTTPLWVALASPYTLNEKVTDKVKTGLSLALAGTIVISLGDICQFQGEISCQFLEATKNSSRLLGLSLALVGAWSAAGYVILGRRVRERLAVIPYVFLVYGSAAVLLALGAIFSGAPLVGFSGSTYFWLLLLGLIPQLIGHSAFNWVLGFLPASIVAVTLLGEPIGSTILALAFLGEVPGIATMAGAILILAGIFYSTRR